MTIYDPLIRLRRRHLDKASGGIFAVCSSHPMVLRAAMRLSAGAGSPLLVEATSNQVNQTGGYTGMTPADYMTFILNLAEENALATSSLMVGADHLGPHVWHDLPAEAAMSRAEELARQCVRAGFGKLHLDTGMRCLDDPGPRLPPETAAQRAVRLCRAAEDAAAGRAAATMPLYVIGHEVPPPGGGLEDAARLALTSPAQLTETLEIHEQAFKRAGLEAAWERVTAVVVQPGVEFGDRVVAPYDSDRAAGLSACHARLPGIMSFEIHATDYQSPRALRRMTADHFSLLKVGPCLTFALREALFALAHIEAALPGISEPSRLPQVMEDLMLRKPGHWRGHYTGNPAQQAFLRRYSLRDRMRYYWNEPEARAAAARLSANLRGCVPYALLHQFLPDLFDHAGGGEIDIDPRAIVLRRILSALQPYADACGPF